MRGFRVCREILLGHLPEEIPAALPEQLRLTGMEEFEFAATEYGQLVWLPLIPRHQHSA